MSNIKYSGDITLACSVKDLNGSVAWFKEMLGFEEIYNMPEEGWAEINTSVPGVSIGLGQNEEVDGSGGVTPVFGVTDVDAARQDLEAKGVTFDGDTNEIPDMVRLATFYDRDGNTFMFAQSLMEG